MTRKERLQKIQEVLEEALGLNWTDRLIYNYNTKIYRSADILDFQPNKATYAYLKDEKKKSYLARVVINDDSFIITINGMKVDASEHWKELLSKELVTTSTK